MLFSTPTSRSGSDLSKKEAIERLSLHALHNGHSNRKWVTSAKENVVVSLDDELPTSPPRRAPPVPEDKLHRRNPLMVRQELQLLDEIIPETTLADVQLSEMPGLQNTEQWKRIAARTVHASPPLSRQYYQTLGPATDLQNGQLTQSLGSYRQPGRGSVHVDPPPAHRSPWRTLHRRIFVGSSIAVVVAAIVVAVVLAVTLSRRTDQSATDYYRGSVHVRAQYDSSLSEPTSTLFRNYKREFCSLIGTTLADTKTKYAVFYSTCSIVHFRNGSIIADFVLGFTRYQNVTRLNSFLNRTLVTKQLFGGTILSIVFNLTTADLSTNDAVAMSNSTNPLTMAEQSSTHEQQPTRTTYTTVTYTTLDKGLSITISETITITNNHTNTNEPLPLTNKNYELILVPTIDNTKTVVVPHSEKVSLPAPPPPPPPPPAASVRTTTITTKSASQQNLLQPIKPVNDANFAYIDESSDDRTNSSADGVSTLDDPTTRDSATSASTSSLNDGTWTDSASTLTNKQTRESTSRPTTRVTVKPKNDSSEDKQVTPSRPNAYQAVKRQRRLIPGKNHRRLLQYELMPTGKVYYVDRPVPNESRPNKTEQEENSSVMLSTILSRSSSLDTLSDKRYRHRQQDRSHPQSSLKTTEEKLSIGGRLASNHNLAGTSTSPFKPINSHKKRFSSFEPTPESLDRVFDVLIAADKRREEHDFWKEKFDPRTTSTRVPLVNTGRSQDATHSNTIPFLRNKPTPLHANAATTTNRTSTAPRSQSYTNQRATVYESFNRPPGCLLEDCLRRRTLILQQQQLPQRNYSPNTVYSTTYPKAQLPPTGKPPLPTSTANSSQPVRILPISNGRLARAPQARQTSDELSSTSDVWATRSSLEEETPPGRKVARYPTRFPSAVNRSRAGELRESNSKRASSVEQQKHPQTQQKTHSGKSKFLDLFKFNR